VSHVESSHRFKFHIGRWSRSAAVDQGLHGHQDFHLAPSALEPDARWVDDAAGDRRGNSIQ
jgi:hypothetical protein